MAQILLVEGSASLRHAYAATLRSEGHRVTAVADGAGALAAMSDARYQVAFIDMTQTNSSDDRSTLCAQCRALHPDCRIVLIADGPSFQAAAAEVRRGAYEILVKPFSEFRLHNCAVALHDPPPEEDENRNAPLGGFQGRSVRMGQMFATIRAYGRSGAPVLIRGAPGTEKGRCARAVHLASGRAEKPFIELDCRTRPVEQLEAELMGHLRGAFVGALSDRAGAAQLAHEGTLFLDEVGALPRGLQPMLLDIIRSATVQPVGSTVPHRINIRLVCTTTRDLDQAVADGEFDNRLRDRLCVLPLDMPNLADLGDDVLEIATARLRTLAREKGRRFVEFAPDLAPRLQTLPWPGNLAELTETLRHVVTSHDGTQVELEMLPLELIQQLDIGPMPARGTAARPRPETFSAGVPRSEAQTATGALATAEDTPRTPAEDVALSTLIGRPLAEIEQLVIEATIAREGGSIPRAARVLQLSPSTIYRKRESWRK
ncbi:MAG: sigma-54-dependent Fis family transcriptional regulator [Confluentimicrobium sp.]|nr:sigma-54-dependent Fis family transcriptional regulator [Actibacterium sp.]